ncbi:hypothetical protein [Pseudogracilibacillus sp. SO30301A]|uniref:hypothetical protein n=1 Tax=Pseudogracilibacillus sp. SO30301A TaxID=3098291 RepID=UPI00300E5811
MFTFKKICLYICIILLILSLYNDIQKGTNNKTNESSTMDDQGINKNIPVVKIKVEAGDTILSVSEELNGEKLNQIKIEDILDDFNSVNPEVTTIELTPGMYYYFPTY